VSSELIRLSCDREEHQTATYRTQSGQARDLNLRWLQLSLCSHLHPALPLSLVYLSSRSSGEGSLPWLAVPTFTTAVPVENAFINAANSNLHLEIPLDATSYPQRGGRQNKILLIYDGAFWWISGNSWQATKFRLVDAGMRVVSTDSAGGISYSRINRSNAHSN
jgi:hypothetical protein